MSKPSEPDATTLGLDRRRVPDASAPISVRVVGDAIFDSHPLPASGQLVIGRGKEADIRIDHPSISRQHARLYIGDRYRIEDLGSANGTVVADSELLPGEPAEIACGDVVDLGSVMLILQRGYRPAPPQAEQKARTIPDGERSSAVIIADPEMQRLYKLVDRVAPSDITVLILGETGAGKELVAEQLHRRSKRANKPLLRLNCGGLTESLLESELFGYEKGAFTGAVRTKPGLLETAHGGTVFLDEIGEMAPALQAKLLRVLEDRQVMRLGGLSARTVDVRFVAATNRDLEQEAARGAFRQDLYYRLSAVTVVVPPLRQRPGEIAPLAAAFAKDAAARHNKTTPQITGEAIARLQQHTWPGNIRELKNCIERAVLLCVDDTITAGQLPVDESDRPLAAQSSAQPAPLRDEVQQLERRRVLDAMEACGGNQTRAAKVLGISRNTLAARLDEYGIKRPRKRRR